MDSQKLYIKNMVCDRCKMVVRLEMDKLQIPYGSIELGEVSLTSPNDKEKLNALALELKRNGFELIEDKGQRTISAIKIAILDYVRDSSGPRKFNFSDYLSSKLNKDYSSLSKLFSEVEGTTIEKYLILQKIERVKELLVYDEMNLSEIAHALHYSSVQHLSNQFKKITGLTPSHFKKIGDNRRKPIDLL
ncbi:MAG: helix-turn-helix domain-containing protein [Cyclobacteriaceae bacterium]